MEVTISSNKGLSFKGSGAISNQARPGQSLKLCDQAPPRLNRAPELSDAFKTTLRKV
jgi:hypothetical protein